MERDQFTARLQAEGYPEVRINELEPNRHNAEHQHPFDVLALVLEGEITLTVPQGVKYLAGRRPV
jgi:quercetin dioxygenase-like cupin family protein